MVKKARKKARGIESRFIDLTELDTEQSMTIWGRPGTGKTTFASTAPKPMMFLDIKDKGTESAKSLDLEEGDITVLQVETFDDVMEVFDYLQDNTDDFKSVVIDHLSALQELAYQKVMDENNKNRMSQQLYGFASEIMKDFIDSYKDLSDEGILPIFIVQDRTRSGEDESGEQLDPEVGPALQPAVAKYLMAGTRVVAQTYITEVQDKKSQPGKVLVKTEYRLRLGPHPYYQTKVTKPKDAEMPDSITDPTVQAVLDIIKGKYTSSKKKPKKGKRNRKK